ncbi:DNA-binding transcriptional activator of the SARP family [Lentzea xinjiangensis]|uniref:DNA-binding transcriptional activator of the SARP family n=1 Tax=Lentzea xinjiangensis TaxID=402600 RepID=A0A1H9WIM5_9PSEU|nr:BTAD domain-containing putative transcriptional regulator [Lentzea xinjiangensis]SES33776.1 DNA-binding transcriptional activator of the SARP family [Lentzea xinjiangensis]
MEIAFRILGRTSLRTADGFVVNWGKPKERAVLAVLLFHAGRPVSVRTLVNWVWSDEGPSNPQSTLQTHIARIRSALHDAGLPGVITNVEREYRLEVDRSLIDFFASSELARKAKSAALQASPDVEQACALYEEAISLWIGEPLADLESDLACDRRRVVVRDHYLPVMNGLLYSLGKLHRYEEMLAHLNEIQPEHDLDVMLARHRLVALYGLRKRVEAVSYYVDVRRRIQAELADGSEKELWTLHEELRQQHAQRAVSVQPGPRPQYLPHSVDAFTGHTDLLAELSNLVLPHPSPKLISLDGPPGVGKTTLAVHWASSVRERFPDGYWFASLDGVAHGPRVEAAQVVKDLLAEFGVAADAIPSLEARTARLRELLANRRMLVVLDNVEDTDHVRSLLPALSNCVVLMTSRTRLSELAVRHRARCLTVEPLGRDDTVAWLGHRLGRRADPAVVGRLAELAGGMPLAMALIGEQVAAQPGRSIDDVVRVLASGRALLSLGDGSSCSIRTAFELSYRNLSAEQKRLFRLLGLHPVREVSLDIVAALAGVEREEARQLVDSLVWTRLVDATDGDRYRMHDLLRQYAAECAERDEGPAERASAVHRLISWYMGTVHNADRRVVGFREEVPMLPLPPGVRPRDFVDEDDVARWCLEEENALVAVIQHVAGPEHVWRLANAVGELLLRYSRTDSVIAVMEAGAAAARMCGEISELVDTLQNLGFVHLNARYDHQTAERCIREAREIFGDRDDPETLAVLLRNEASCLRGAHNVPRAVELYEQALALAVTDDTRAGILHRLGEVCGRGGRLDEAAAYLYEGLHVREKLADTKGQGDSRLALAQLAYDLGDSLSASGSAHLAAGLFQQAHYRPGEASALTLLGAVTRDRGDLDTARHYATRAIELARGDRRREGEAHDLLGQVEWKAGELDVAVEQWEMAFAAFRDIGDDRADAIAAHLDELGSFGQPAVPQSRPEYKTGSQERSEILRDLE